ncbi:unnamed protein product [Calypogeia fissa]
MPMAHILSVQGHPLIPLASRSDNYISLGSSMDRPVTLDDETEDTYNGDIGDLEGVRSCGVSKRRPDDVVGAHTPPSQRHKAFVPFAPSTPNPDRQQLSRKELNFSGMSSVKEEGGMSVRNKGSMSAKDKVEKRNGEKNIVNFDKKMDNTEVVCMFTALQKQVSAQKLETQNHLIAVQETLAQKDSTIYILKKEKRVLQDDGLKANRVIADLKVRHQRAIEEGRRERVDLTLSHQREIEDLKETLLKYKTQIDDLKDAMVKKTITIDTLTIEHEKEIEKLKTSFSIKTALLEDQHRKEVTSMKDTLCSISALVNNVKEPPECSSVHLTQVSLCKQELQPGQH